MIATTLAPNPPYTLPLAPYALRLMALRLTQYHPCIFVSILDMTLVLRCSKEFHRTAVPSPCSILVVLRLHALRLTPYALRLPPYAITPSAFRLMPYTPHTSCLTPHALRLTP